MDDLYLNSLQIRESSVRPFDPVQPAYTPRGQMAPILIQAHSLPVQTSSLVHGFQRWV